MKKTPKEKKKQAGVLTCANVRHGFTTPEKMDLAMRQVASLQRITELAEQLQSVSADFKAKMKTENAMVNEITNKLSNGYEMRTMECFVVMDRRAGIKRFHLHAPTDSKADGKVVKEEPMSPADYETLPMDEKPVAPPPKGKKGGGKKGDAKPDVAAEIKDALEANQVGDGKEPLPKNK